MRSFFEADQPFTGNRSTFALPAPDVVYASVLAANAAETVTIPAGATFVVFGATGDFFARFGSGTATVVIPTGDLTDGSAGEINPSTRRIAVGTDRIGLISDTDCIVTMSFFGGAL